MFFFFLFVSQKLIQCKNIINTAFVRLLLIRFWNEIKKDMRMAVIIYESRDQFVDGIYQSHTFIEFRSISVGIKSDRRNRIERAFGYGCCCISIFIFRQPGFKSNLKKSITVDNKKFKKQCTRVKTNALHQCPVTSPWKLNIVKTLIVLTIFNVCIVKTAKNRKVCQYSNREDKQHFGLL